MAAAVAVPAEAARPARPIAASTPSASWQRAARVPALGLPGDLGEEAGGAGWGQGVPIQNSSQGGELGLLSMREIAAAVVRNAGLWVPEIVSPA